MRPDILTSTGRYFDFVNPTAAMIDIHDIAQGLSNICRFNGQCKKFYSVAQHSLLVSRIVPEEFALLGLMHDAAEAYVGDVTAPLKRLLPDYKVIEARVHDAIFARYELPAQLPACIKEADLIALATEQRDLMPPHDDEWASIKNVKPLPFHIEPMSATVAYECFLNEFYRLAAI